MERPGGGAGDGGAGRQGGALMERRRWGRIIAQRKHPCFWCGGVGYLQRIHDASRVKCPHCDGSGEKDERARNGGR